MFIDVSPSMSFDSSWVNVLKYMFTQKKKKTPVDISTLALGPRPALRAWQGDYPQR